MPITHDMATTDQEAVDPAARIARFSDVCGTTDELKRVLYEEAESAAARPEVLESLVDDALFMEARMELRLREYERFRDEVVDIVAVLQQIGGSRRQEALAQSPRLKRLLRLGRPLEEAEREEAVDLAETIRGVAQHLEDNLGAYKNVALALGRAYRNIQGNRHWVLDEQEAEAAAHLAGRTPTTVEVAGHDAPEPQPGEPEWARWLPPSPHRERILRHLRAGRAYLLPPEGDARSGGVWPPLVQFEDGGVMPLPVVRWSEEVRNFYPKGSPPHPRGRLYRGRDRRGQATEAAGGAPQRE